MVMIKGRQTLIRLHVRAHVHICATANGVQAHVLIADRPGTETGSLFDNSGGAL